MDRTHMYVVGEDFNLCAWKKKVKKKKTLFCAKDRSTVHWPAI